MDYGPPISHAVNTCKVDSDCRFGAMGGACREGKCIASTGQIETAYLEVIPPASASYGSGDSFLIKLDGLSHGSSLTNLSLPGHAEIQGTVSAGSVWEGDLTPESCEQVFDALTQTLRVHVELWRVGDPYGLPSWTLATNAERGSGNVGWVFRAKAPPGTYDVYATVMGGCISDFPPLIERVEFGSGAVRSDIQAGSLSKLSGELTPPTGSDEDQSLARWAISLVDPMYGKVISTVRKLGAGGTNFDILYRRLPTSWPGGSPWVQIEPPSDVVAPVLAWDLSALDVAGENTVKLDLSTLDLSTVRVSATVMLADLEPVVNASVQLRSTALVGASLGFIARYDTKATTDDDGMISIDLLPGTYQVVVTPPDPTDLPITYASWKIGRTPSLQEGRTIEVGQKLSVVGTVVDPTARDPMESIAATAVPSVMPAGMFIERIVEPIAMVPRVASSITGAGGAFVMGVDPGLLDITAQPVESSGFPWLVRTRVGTASDSSDGSVGTDLGDMAVSYPVLLDGILTHSGRFAVQQARLRVFALVVSSPDPERPNRADAPRVMLVAEGRTGKNGEFELFLPSEILED